MRPSLLSAVSLKTCSFLQGAFWHHVRSACAAGISCAAAAGRGGPGQPAGARQCMGRGGSQVCVVPRVSDSRVFEAGVEAQLCGCGLVVC